MHCNIDGELVERYALGKLPDADWELVTVMETCPECQWRIQEARQWEAAIKKAVAAGPYW